MSTIEERVARGAAWLDEERPGWVAEIDLERLQLSECCECVIGQTFGCYASADNPFDLDINVALDYGFNAEDHSNWSGENRELTHEWRRVITERRAAA